jgi:hypothetical protein
MALERHDVGIRRLRMRLWGAVAMSFLRRKAKGRNG